MMLGVSNAAVQQWENGASQPNSDNMAKLVALMGPETMELWAAWWSRRPAVELPLTRAEAERVAEGRARGEIAEVAAAAEATARQLEALMRGEQERERAGEPEVGP